MVQTLIMVVEDEAIVGVDIQECLQEFGYGVLGPFATGEEAVQQALKNKPALVLMDIMLRGKLDGIGAAEEIKAKLGIPVIFLTAYADSATLARAKVTEPYGYVLKPFKKIELRTVVELALYRSEMEVRRSGSGERSAEPIAKSSAIFSAPLKPAAVTADTESIFAFLQSVEPLQRMETSTLRSIATLCTLEPHKSGDVILTEGEDKQSAFIVVTGRVVLVKSSPSGKDLIVEVLPPGDPFGMLAALEKGTTPFSAKAQIDSLVLWVPRKIITEVLDQYSEVGRILIERILGRLRKSHDLSRALAHDRVEVRVASALLALVPPSLHLGIEDAPVKIKLSRQELADMTGTAPETASRVANALEREGILDLSQMGEVKILDHPRLAGLIQI